MRAYTKYIEKIFENPCLTNPGLIYLQANKNSLLKKKSVRYQSVKVF